MPKSEPGIDGGNGWTVTPGAVSTGSRHHDHAGLTCGEVGCHTGDPLFAAQLQGIWGHFFLHYRPKTRTFSTDLRVFEAFLHVSQQVESFDVDMSVRRLSELSTVSENTTWESLQRIIKAGYLTQVPTNRSRQIRALAANTYRVNWKMFNLHTHTNHDKQKNENDVAMCTNFGTSGHDAWAFVGGLANAYVTYQALKMGISTPTALAAFADLSVPAVRRHLRRLEASRLTEQKPDGTWIALQRSLDEVAQERGTTGTRQRREAAHDFERDDYRNDLRQRCLDASAAFVKKKRAAGRVQVRPGCLGARFIARKGALPGSERGWGMSKGNRGTPPVDGSGLAAGWAS